MSETLAVLADPIYEAVAITHEDRAYLAETPTADKEEEPWGSELMNHVLANQNVIVRCPWMGGAKVTLGELSLIHI